MDSGTAMATTSFKIWPQWALYTTKASGRTTSAPVTEKNGTLRVLIGTWASSRETRSTARAAIRRAEIFSLASTRMVKPTDEDA